MIKINDRFGNLVVVSIAERKSKTDLHKYYICKCDCGKEIIVRSTCLRLGQKCCGCENKKTFLKNIKKHGMYGTRIYRIWNGILSRTKYKSKKEKDCYWGRGIKVCEEWSNDFLSFYNWAMENGYNDNLTIDRIDVNGNYCPENCRWITKKEQANNRRTNKNLTINGETKTISQWSEYFNMSYNAVLVRLKKGKTNDVFAKPVKKKFIIEYKKEFFSLKEICILLKKPYKSIHRSYKKGKDLSSLLNADIKIIQKP